MNSKKTIVAGLIGVILVAGIFYYLNNSREQINPQENVQVKSDYKNISYVISGQNIKLTDGYSEIEAAPGSASKTVTKYFGNEIRKDLNGDGSDDIAFLITQATGGSGTFFYAVAALEKNGTYAGSHAVYIGDRIAPQTTESGPGRSIIINYADRKPNEPFTASPSVGKSLRLLLDEKTMQFGEVVQDFEGEADPSRMTLGMKKWVWVSTSLNNGTELKPKLPGKFTLTFNSGNTFSASTDCNGIGGDYSSTKDSLVFSNMMSTLMYCEGSQEDVFRGFLTNTSSYHFTSKGELILNLKFDSGTVLFR